MLLMARARLLLRLLKVKLTNFGEELGSLSVDYIISHAKAVQKDAEELEKAEAEYHHAIALADKKIRRIWRKTTRKANYF
jgi:hypothetical protein